MADFRDSDEGRQKIASAKGSEMIIDRYRNGKRISRRVVSVYTGQAIRWTNEGREGMVGG